MNSDKNLMVRKQARQAGVNWHYTTWLASAHDLHVVPQSICALSYEAQESRDGLFIDEPIREAVLNSASPEELLCNLDTQGLHGWVTKVLLRNRMFLETGEEQMGRTTLDFWFYAETPEALHHKINAWAHQKIKDMKQNNDLARSQKVVDDVMGVSA